jgi:hypothetical protein
MNENSFNEAYLLKYKIGDFVPEENAFYHLCKREECDNHFVGRKNRAYCSSVCKNRVNNDKQSERDLVVSKEMSQFKKNQLILERLHQENPTKVQTKVLFQRGFDSEGVSRMVKWKHFEGTWYVFGNYAIQNQDDDTTLILNTTY